MIIIYEGTPGSGKSYTAVQRIIENIAKGRRTLTNLDGMDDPKAPEMISNLIDKSRAEVEQLLVFLKPDQLNNFWELGQINDFFVIDEVQKVFNSRDFAKVQNRAFGDWASTHRHLGQDLILISQRLERIESSVRSLAEFTYRFRKLNIFGGAVQKHYLQYCYAGDDTTAKPLTLKRMKYDPAVFACYSSYFADQAKERQVMQGVNILKHPVFYALAVSVCLTIFFFSKSGMARGDIFGAKSVMEKAESNKSETVEAKSVDLPVTTAPAQQDFSFRRPPGHEQQQITSMSQPIEQKEEQIEDDYSFVPPPKNASPEDQKNYRWVPYTALGGASPNYEFITIEGGLLSDKDWLYVDVNSGLVYCKNITIKLFKQESINRYAVSQKSPSPRL